MQIIHRIDDFLFTLFPKAEGGGNDLLINYLESYYTFGPFKPRVKIDREFVIVEIDTSTIQSQDSDYRKVIALCERGKYSEAKPILENLIEHNPTNSEFHRIRGQIFSDEGKQEEAIDCLVDALRWDPKNSWALIMMGNILARHKDDIKTAMTYYDQALVAHPNDNIAINNIGATLMQQGKVAEAEKYFLKALDIDSNYPNTHFALGMLAELKNDLLSAFSSTLKAVKLNSKNDGLYHNSVKQLFELSKEIVKSDEIFKTVNEYKSKLEIEGDVSVKIIEDESIPTTAKLELAETYKRQQHTIRYKPGYPAVMHLLMHELVHLELILQARKNNVNQLFISSQQHKTSFIKSLERDIKRLNKKNLPEKAISDYVNALFEGINSQLFNTPIDLFIEQKLYTYYEALRPYQFLSLYILLQQGLKAVTDKTSVELSPRQILSKSKVLNLVNALQFKDMYGIDMLADFKATRQELQQATSFYEEYKDYKDDKEPGEEYELVLHWAQDLNLEANFELVDENDYYSKRLDSNKLLDEIENDPFDGGDRDLYKKAEQQKFKESQEASGTNMAVVMYMVAALKYFNKMNKEEIKKIAFDIAMLGTQGIRPDSKDYSIASIPGKSFTGYQMLAYYYVSWALAIPEMLSQLQLPYEDEYKLATSLFKEE